METMIPSYDAPQRFDLGIGRCTFRISDDKVAKFGAYFWEARPRIAKRQVDKEYGIARDLHRGGVLIPEPIGVYKIPIKVLDDEGKRKIEVVRPAFVMSYIEGRVLGDLKGEEKTKALEMRKEEIEKCKRLKLVPIDFENKGNSILGNDQRLYLIDFDHWGRSDARSRVLNRIRDWVSDFRWNHGLH